MSEHAANGPDRYALYYPYIHIRDENWLKGTLLAFQQVRRIVPNKFTVKDGAITKPYADLKGPAGPLLEPVFVDAPEIHESQQRLRAGINEHLDEIVLKYAEAKVPQEFHSGPKAFEMHVGKFLDPGLLDLLKSKQLAWHSRDPSAPDSSNWITMHPKLGAAMMSVLGLAVARLKGLNVVTPSGSAHHALLANREEQVFEKLLEVPAVPGQNGGPNVAVEELAHVVITLGFDLTRLTPDQICELLNQGKDLRAFRNAVAAFAQRIPPGLDSAERGKRLKQEAQAVLEEWAGYTSTLPSFAKESLYDAALDKIPEKVIEAGITAAAAGATTATMLGALPGIAITFAVASGINMFKKHNTPLRFLTRVNKVVDRSIGSIYVPQWRALMAQQT